MIIIVKPMTANLSCLWNRDSDPKVISLKISLKTSKIFFLSFGRTYFRDHKTLMTAPLHDCSTKLTHCPNQVFFFSWKCNAYSTCIMFFFIFGLRVWQSPFQVSHGYRREQINLIHLATWNGAKGLQGFYSS